MKKFCCISDTHGIHKKLDIPPCDFLVHSGDIHKKYKIEFVRDFVEWFVHAPSRYKILVAGNHDRFIAREKERFLEMIDGKIIYLENSGTEIEGIKFWGIPSVKWCGPYKHFTYLTSDEEVRIFSKIPVATDILITHSPPYGILDSSPDIRNEGGRRGSKALLDMVNRIRPRYHIFGHEHTAYGIMQNQHTIFINSSIVNNSESLLNKPIIFDFNL
jgi:Icc-related predicted phosphoesterase